MNSNDETLYQSNSPEQMSDGMMPPPFESSTASPADAPKERKDNSWKKVVIGGTTGILLGGAAMYATNAFAGDNEPIDNPDEDSSQNISQEIQQQQQATISQQQATIAQQQATIAQQNHPHIVEPEPIPHNPLDDLPFDEAFAAARDEVGPGGVFHWHGGVYGTFNAEEWSALSEDERYAFYQATQDEFLEADGHSHSFVHHIDTVVASPLGAVHTDYIGEAPEKVDADLQADDDAMMRASLEEESGVKTIEDVVENMDDVHLVHEDVHDDGSVTRVYNVDNINAVGFDIDGNGQNDVAAVDMNQNNDLDQGEMVRTDTMEPLDLDELAAAAESQPDPNPNLHDASYDTTVEDNSMPDYMDDAPVDM